MPNAHPFGATNEPDTCLWCGAPLRQNYTMGQKVLNGKRMKTYRGEWLTGETWEETREEKKYKIVGRTPTGKGWENNGYFCTLRCGEAFGKAMARNGHRFEPKEDKEE